MDFGSTFIVIIAINSLTGTVLPLIIFRKFIIAMVDRVLVHLHVVRLLPLKLPLLHPLRALASNHCGQYGEDEGSKSNSGRKNDLFCKVTEVNVNEVTS